jgi:flagella basal body P-ring formation protein FlgA
MQERKTLAYKLAISKKLEKMYLTEATFFNLVNYGLKEEMDYNEFTEYAMLKLLDNYRTTMERFANYVKLSPLKDSGSRD